MQQTMRMAELPFSRRASSLSAQAYASRRIETSAVAQRTCFGYNGIMKGGPDIATIGALGGDPARANMLTALLGGQALTAGELAREAGVTAQTASSHLSRLEAGGLRARGGRGRRRGGARAGGGGAGGRGAGGG